MLSAESETNSPSKESALRPHQDSIVAGFHLDEFDGITASRYYDGAGARVGETPQPGPIPEGARGKNSILDSGLSLAPARIAVDRSSAAAPTMAAKAEIFEARAQAIMNPFGLLGKSNDIPIWTGVYIAGEAYRYKATGDPQALAYMERCLRGFHTLYEISGNNGIFARNIRPATPEDATAKLPYDQHLGKGKYAGYVWTGGPSWDQYTGYLFGIAEAWDQIQDPELKKALAEDLRQGAHNFMRNKGMFISEDTHLDSSSNYYYQDRLPKVLRWIATPLTHLLPARGGNPLSGLEFMRIAASATGDADIEAYYRGLIEKKNYAWYVQHKTAGATEKMMHDHDRLFNFIARTLYGRDVKVTPDSMRSPVGTNLQHIAFYDLMRWEKDPKILEAYAEGYREAHAPVARHGNTFWNFLAVSQLGGDPAGIADGVDSLKRFPLDYGTRKNSDDPSIPKYKGLSNNFYNRKPHWEWFSVDPLPIERRPMHTFAWQQNAMNMDGSFNYRDADGSAYLAAYWFGRSHGYISPEQ